MASQTVMTLCSSSTPKLATFKSPTPTLLPLNPPRTFSDTSSLAMPCLKASYGGISVLRTSQFKCYAASGTQVLEKDIESADGQPPAPEEKPDKVVPGKVDDPKTSGIWEDIKDADKSQEVESLGKFAVEEYQKKERKDIKFQKVAKAQRQIADDGDNYWLLIKGEVEILMAVVYVGAPVPPKKLKSSFAI